MTRAGPDVAEVTSARFELGDGEPLPDRRVPPAVAALGYREFASYWLAGIVSNSGSMMYLAAIGWVVAVQTDSALLVTLVAFIGLVPMLVLSPVGGALADRFPRKRLLMMTIIGQMISAAALAAVYQAGLASFWVLFTFSVVGGCTGALGAPVQQALVPELVPHSHLRNAVVLNSTQYNVARAAGPMVAGLMIDITGPGVVFWFNALSFGAVLLALSRMRPSPAPHSTERDGYVREFTEGARYAWSVPGIRMALLGASVVAFVSSPLQWLAPVVARQAFDATATQYGLLLGAMGIGAIVGGIGLLAFERGTPNSWLVARGYPTFAAAVLVLAVSPYYWLGVAAMFVGGMAFIVLGSSHNSSLQAVCEDRFRGRVLSLWMMIYGGVVPVSVLLQGSLADVVGIRWVLAADSMLLLGFVIWAAGRGMLAHLDPVPRRRTEVVAQPATRRYAHPPRAGRRSLSGRVGPGPPARTARPPSNIPETPSRPVPCVTAAPAGMAPWPHHRSSNGWAGRPGSRPSSTASTRGWPTTRSCGRCTPTTTSSSRGARSPCSSSSTGADPRRTRTSAATPGCACATHRS